MIERIDIANFGSYKDFEWNVSVRDTNGNPKNFKKLNLFYGKNYSGKTTLSRVFRCLHTGHLPPKYQSPSFSVSTSQGIIDQNSIPDKDNLIRVYNKDFVDDHLSFLRDSDGNITPFAVVGSENTVIDKVIPEKEMLLGNIDQKSGIRYDLFIKTGDLQEAKKLKGSAERALRDKLFAKANAPQGGIKHNPIYRDPNYDVRKINLDIQTIRTRSFMIPSESERQKKEALLGESALPDINLKITFTPSISSLYAQAKELVTRSISPSHPIQELLNDAVLQAWVKEGVPHHKGKRSVCGFCGGALPNDLWERLGAHFSQDSIDLEKALLKHIDAVHAEKNIVDCVITLDRDNFYKSFHPEFENARDLLAEDIKKYQYLLDHIIKSMQQRLDDIFTPQSVGQLNDNSQAIEANIYGLNALIKNNNQKTKSLHDDQEAAREELRLSEVANFVQNIMLDNEERKIKALSKKVEELQVIVEKLNENVISVEKEIDNLRFQHKDEKRGAERVNNYLNNYFGHESLSLRAVQDDHGSAYKFQIMRGEDPAYNLSEGECSLVSFCYFIAKLDEIESKGKQLTIFIDDPVSSLDTNHIFFVFSLIESVIASPMRDEHGKDMLGHDRKKQYRYAQLFVSTHNLEFLKYLKKLSAPTKNLEQFMVVCRGGKSVVELMPSYLRNYITEFNHLFNELYPCIYPHNATTHHHCFYDFGNNLRRFLEAFLFFKYPFSANSQEDYNRRIRMFFASEPTDEIMVQRLTNEYSHLGGCFDRGMQPIDHAEISKLAVFVLKKIKKNDETQFKCLLESIEKPDPW